MRQALSRLLALLVLVPVLLVPVLSSTSGAHSHCARSGPQGAGFKVTVCITAPSEGAVLSGTVPVTTSVTTSDGRDARAVVYSLDDRYLLTDSQPPFTFLLPTERWVDDPDRALSAQAKVDWSSGTFTSEAAVVTVGFANGVTEPPPRAKTFVPRTADPGPGEPLVVASVGDGVDGRSFADDVIGLIDSWDPDLVLYLGDVYERGTYTEFVNWSDDSRWGRFDDITNPAPGNHEYETPRADGYFDYWEGPRKFYSFDAGGWHIVTVNSNGEEVPTELGSPQYEWLANDLWRDDSDCALAFYHHSLFTLSRSGASWMWPIWELLADGGVDVSLSAHEHNYVRWKPLDEGGAYDPQGVTSFIVGTGGHYRYPFTQTDDRAAKGIDSGFGALRLELWSDHAVFEFFGSGGALLDTGTISCTPAVDDKPPTTPQVTAIVTGAHEVDLSWPASSDNVAVDGYRVYRGGGLVATLGPGELGYSDVCLAAETAYSYEVEAFDAAGNSARSSPTPVMTPAESDVTAPSIPGGVMAEPVNPYRIRILWAASDDDTGVCSYEVTRDGVLVGTTTTTSLFDSDLAPDTSYSYKVRALDAAGNVSDPGVVVGETPPLIFADDFETGGLSRWTKIDELYVDTDLVHSGTFAARARGVNDTAHAIRRLGAEESDLHGSAWFRLVSKGPDDAVNLLRFRTSTGSGVVSVYLSPTGKLAVRNEVARTRVVSQVAIAPGSWHELQLHVVVNDSEGEIEVWLDGSGISALSGAAPLGTVPVSRLQIGEHVDGRTFDVAFDDVAADTTYIR